MTKFTMFINFLCCKNTYDTWNNKSKIRKRAKKRTKQKPQNNKINEKNWKTKTQITEQEKESKDERRFNASNERQQLEMVENSEMNGENLQSPRQWMFRPSTMLQNQRWLQRWQTTVIVTANGSCRRWFSLALSHNPLSRNFKNEISNPNKRKRKCKHETLETLNFGLSTSYFSFFWPF